MSTEKKFTVAQMKAALLAVQDRITPAQLLMLTGHYGCRIASMEKIANFGGYGDNFRAANIQYGTLCGRIAEQLGFRPQGDKTSTIAFVFPERDENGCAQWQMDDVVATALEELKWVTRGARANRAATLRILDRAGKGNPPMEGDELPPERDRLRAKKVARKPNRAGKRH